MKMIVDRIEGELIVVEMEESMYHLPKALCPNAKEGDTLEITVTEKQPQKEETHAIFERLRKNSRRSSEDVKKPCKNPSNCESAVSSKGDENPDQTEAESIG